MADIRNERGLKRLAEDPSDRPTKKYKEDLVTKKQTLGNLNRYLQIHHIQADAYAEEQPDDGWREYWNNTINIERYEAGDLFDFNYWSDNIFQKAPQMFGKDPRMYGEEKYKLYDVDLLTRVLNNVNDIYRKKA